MSARDRDSTTVRIGLYGWLGVLEGENGTAVLPANILHFESVSFMLRDFHLIVTPACVCASVPTPGREAKTRTPFCPCMCSGVRGLSTPLLPLYPGRPTQGSSLAVCPNHFSGTAPPCTDWWVPHRGEIIGRWPQPTGVDAEQVTMRVPWGLLV